MVLTRACHRLLASSISVGDGGRSEGESCSSTGGVARFLPVSTHAATYLHPTIHRRGGHIQYVAASMVQKIHDLGLTWR